MQNMILNLDPHFKPIAGEEVPFEAFTFAGGEPHIKIKTTFPMEQAVSITHRLNSFHDVGLLCLAADALVRLGARLHTLVIPYFPAARQDRLMVPGEPLSVKVYADIINSLGFQRVIVFDAHSEVTPALVNRCQVVANHRFIQKVLDVIGEDAVLISPDGGALKKIYKLSEALGGKEVVECSKSRNVKTGQLSGFKVYADDLQGRACLIVDDICDGGGTFIGLAQELKRKNAGKLYLAVSHGIFSKGLAELAAHFEMIFATDSVREMAHESLVQIQIKELL